MSTPQLMIKYLLSTVALMSAMLTHGFLSLPVQAATQVVFNTIVPENDLQGSLQAQVLFAQSQIFPANPRQDDYQPRLTSLRKTLLLVRPLNADNNTPTSVIVRDGQGNLFGSLDLHPPELLPRTADGRWVKKIYLPRNKALDGKIVRARSQALQPPATGQPPDHCPDQGPQRD